MKNDIEKLEFSTILASSIHDMKNSLAMLLGSLADISSVCQGEHCSQKISKIRHEGQRVNRDLIQLLTLYKIDKKRYYLNIEEVEVYDFLEDIREEYAYLLADHGVEITLDCDDGICGFFDKELVYGVLSSIVNNAYQYAKNKILIKVKHDNDYLILSIMDNGAGYPKQMLHDPVAKTTPSHFDTGSTGLGLYFAAQVASLHRNKKRQGYIQVSNNEAKGCGLSGGCFSIFLP